MADGLVLVSVLERKAADSRASQPAQSVNRDSPLEKIVRLGRVSVDDISGQQYTALRGLGWTISGAMVFDPQAVECQSAFKRDPFWGVIGVEQGPPAALGLGRRDHQG